MRSTLQHKETQVVERTCDQDLKNLGLKVPFRGKKY